MSESQLTLDAWEVQNILDALNSGISAVPELVHCLAHPDDTGNALRQLAKVVDAFLVIETVIPASSDANDERIISAEAAS